MSNNEIFSLKFHGELSKENSKIYFTCHPDDFDKYFSTVTDDILSISDCVILYTEDMTADISDENSIVLLERTSLFVVPVTYKLLTQDNRAMSYDIKFAQEKHIPVLPLIMEPDIYEFYKRPENFGDMQYLKPINKDDTAISYKKKLKDYLESVIIDSDTSQKIRNAFDAYIFLSYRKKDRKYANDLMKLIHKNPECEDIAIWFDEYLRPGESFRENIERILNNSKLFALLVTPRLLEKLKDGNPNYVMKSEYPAAKQAGKPILPAEMEKTDQTALKKEFAGIPECSDINDEDSFRKRLLDSLIGIATSENDNDPEHNYLIGLAYMKGIDVEVDIIRGERLLTKAAEAGLPGAMEKLFEMYRDGDGVNYDSQKELYWIEKLYNSALRNLGEEHQKTIIAMSLLANAYADNGDYNKSLELNDKCYQLCKKAFGEYDPETLKVYSNLALNYTITGDIQKNIELNHDIYELKRNHLGEDDPETILSLNNLAGAYFEIEDYDKSLELFKESLEQNKKLYGEKGAETLNSLNNVAGAFLGLGNYDESLKLFRECYNLRCETLGKDNPETLITAGNLALVYKYLGDTQKSLELTEDCYEQKRIVFGDDHPETLKTLNNLAICYRITGNLEKSTELHGKCFSLRSKRLGKDHPLTKDSLDNYASALEQLAFEHLNNQKPVEFLQTYTQFYELCRNEYGEDDERTINADGILKMIMSDDDN